MLETKAVQTVKRHKMLPKKGTLLVALSGGPDSVALLHFLKKSGYKVIAAHLNHCLRGRDAVRDVFFVRELCRGMGVELVAGKADVKKTSKKLGLSIEEAGRLKRYAFLEQTAGKYGASRIALAHHADDNIETFLMRSMRGTGLKGLCGIPPVRGKIVRPFIDVSKTEILDYCRRNDLRCRQDRTNLENKFTRNKIRNLLIPLLEKESPGIKKEILFLIRAFSRDYMLLCRYISSISGKIIKKDKKGVSVSRQGLSQVPDELKGHVLRSAIEKFKGDLRDITSAHISSVLALSRGYVCLPKKIIVMADRDSYLITDKRKEVVKPVAFKCKLKFPGKVRIKESNVAIRASYSGKPKNIKTVPRSAAYLDASKIKGKYFFIRNAVPGDKFVPLGMKGFKKLQDYFVDSKIPFEERALIPVVCDAEKILWLAGLRTDERVKLDPSSKRTIKLEMLS